MESQTHKEKIDILEKNLQGYWNSPSGSNNSHMTTYFILEQLELIKDVLKEMVEDDS